MFCNLTKSQQVITTTQHPSAQERGKRRGQEGQRDTEREETKVFSGSGFKFLHSVRFFFYVKKKKSLHKTGKRKC